MALEEQYERELESAFPVAIKEWMQWTRDNFPKSGAKASLIHLQEEIEEVLKELDADEPYMRQHESTMTLGEFADCLLCLITAAGKCDLSIHQLFSAVMNKAKVNYKRIWLENSDNTYSHVKVGDTVFYGPWDIPLVVLEIRENGNFHCKRACGGVMNAKKDMLTKKPRIT